LAFASPAERVEPLGEGIQAILRDVASVCVPHVVVGDVAAVARGVPREQALLEVCYRLVGGNATPVARLLALWNARSRGVEGAYPFIPDDQTVGESRVLALETRHGPVVLRRCIEPGPEFAKLVAWSDTLDLGSVQVPVVRVAALVAALREIRLPVPATAIAELEATAVVRNRVDLGP
ncbi:MAG TPA: hypothetical protein VKC62_06805, partial [Gaiellaceae bacterium]|nr:hypothetical protein [Gaiellaceae bacterium]